MAAIPSWLSQLLEEENFRKYHAFYEIFKHNHKAHSTVALARLGASEARVKQNCEEQNKRCGIIPLDKNEPLTQKTEADSIKSSNIQDYKGANLGYYRVLDHYENLYQTKYGKDIKKMIKEEFPPVADGPLVAAFHGVIQMAYGYIGGADSLVLEGLALAMSQYSPLQPSDESKIRDVSQFGKGTKDILQVLAEIRQDKAMQEAVKKHAQNEEFKKKCPDNFFDWTSLALLQYFSDHFLQLTDNMKVPDFFDPTKKDMGQLLKVLEWLEDMATVVYVKCELPNQFFLLHGITSTWSMRQVIELVDYNEALIIVRAHICAFLMTYVSTTCPALTKTPEDYWNGSTVNQAAWDVVRKDVMAKDFEDHVFKAVQILYEDWKANPNSPYSKLYIAGARMAIDHAFNLAPFPVDYPNILPEHPQKH